jgi:hypothetical protein
VAGSVRMPGGVQFLHRGIFPVTTAQTDFATDPSNTYHLRWDKTMGFRMIPLTDVAYNPTSLNESNALFDTKFDDMLIARVTTSSSNVATISNLKNATRLEKYERKQGPGVIVSTGGNLDGVQYTTSFDLDWARTPMVALEGVAGQTTSNIMHGFGNAITITSQTRYSLAAYVTTDFLNRMENPASFNPWGYIAMTAFRY